MIQIIGFAGAGLILVGFVRINSGRWSSKSLWYELDNLLGSALLIVYNLSLGAKATLILNVVWMIAAINGIRSIKHRRRAK